MTDAAASETPRRYSRPHSPIPAWSWATLAFVVLAGAALRAPGIGGPIVGYHAFNEAFYLDLATRYLHQSLLAPWLSPLDPNNPPLYPFLLRLVFGAFGPSVLAARLFSATCALGSAVVLYFLGRRFYGDAGGLLAASAIALAPGAVLVGRNIQIDALMGLLVAACVLAWVRAADDDSVWWAVAAGVFAALATLCKLQGVLVVPAIAVAEVVRARSLRALLGREALVALGSFLLVAAPWQIFNLLRPAYTAAQSHLAGMAEVPTGKFFDLYFAQESFWLLSPLLLLLVIGGIIWLAYRHQTADVLVLAGLLANIAFYLVYHHHTYYLYGALPFAALAVGALSSPLRLERPAAAVSAVLVLSLVLSPFALTMLSGKKLGYWSSAQVAAKLRGVGVDPAHTSLAVDKQFQESWEPALRLYGGGMDVISNTLGPKDKLPAGQRVVTLDPVPRPASPDWTSLGQLSDTFVAPVFAGYAVFQGHNAAFFFHMEAPTLLRVGPPWQFGSAEVVGSAPLYPYLLSRAYTDKVFSGASTETSAPATAP